MKQVCADVTWLTSLHNIEETKHLGSTGYLQNCAQGDTVCPAASTKRASQEPVAESTDICGASSPPGGHYEERMFTALRLIIIPEVSKFI